MRQTGWLHQIDLKLAFRFLLGWRSSLCFGGDRITMFAVFKLEKTDHTSLNILNGIIIRSVNLISSNSDVQRHVWWVYVLLYYVRSSRGLLTKKGSPDISVCNIAYACCITLSMIFLIPMYPSLENAAVKLVAGTTNLVGQFRSSVISLWSLISNFGDGITFELRDYLTK
jgi:hypothetical protein